LDWKVAAVAALLILPAADLYLLLPEQPSAGSDIGLIRASLQAWARSAAARYRGENISRELDGMLSRYYSPALINGRSYWAEGYSAAAEVLPGVITGTSIAVPARCTVSLEVSIREGARHWKLEVTGTAPRPDLSRQSLAESMEHQSSGEFSLMADTVMYMATALARARAYYGYGTGPYDTEKNLLNEGDVELIVNMAVLFMEMRYFGGYDRQAAWEIDRNYQHALDASVHGAAWSPYNPTGLRSWGTAERVNYGVMLSHRQETANLSSILDSIQGSFDPADVLLRYLYMDRYYPGQELNLDWSDGTSPLQSFRSLSQRNMSEKMDITGIVQNIPRLPVQFSISHTPHYLIVGRDIHIDKSFYLPRMWKTNVRLGGSRTGGVPPPQPPPDHDFYIYWDFNVSADFALNISGTLRNITAAFPVSVYAWLWGVPMNSAMAFSNLNVGSPPGSTYNFTEESLAYEAFAVRYMDRLKGHISAVVRYVRYMTRITKDTWNFLMTEDVPDAPPSAMQEYAAFSDAWMADVKHVVPVNFFDYPVVLSKEGITIHFHSGYARLNTDSLQISTDALKHPEGRLQGIWSGRTADGMNTTVSHGAYITWDAYTVSTLIGLGARGLKEGFRSPEDVFEYVLSRQQEVVLAGASYAVCDHTLISDQTGACRLGTPVNGGIEWRLVMSY